MSYNDKALMDLPMAKPVMNDGDELTSIVDNKRSLLIDLKDQKHRAENELNRINTLISINEHVVDVLQTVAERCYVMDREHQEFLRRNEPKEATYRP